MNATIDSLPPLLPLISPPLQSDKGAVFSFSKVKTADQLIESVKVGWKASNAIFWPSAIIAVMLNAPEDYWLKIISASACLGGIVFAAKDFTREPSLDHNVISTSKIKTMAKSALQGITDGLTVLGTALGVASLVNDKYCHYDKSCNLRYSLGLASLIIAGVGQTIYSYLCRAEQKTTQAQTITKPNRLSNLVKSIGEGVLTATTLMSSFLTVNLALDRNIHNLEIVVISSSLITAIASSIERYYFNSSNAPVSQKTFRKKFMQSLTAGWKAYGCAMLIGAIAHDIFRLQLDLSLFLTAATSLGIGYGIGTFNKIPTANDADVTVIDITKQEKIPPSPSLASRTFKIIRTGISSVYQKWKTTSKLKKSGIIFASLAAITTLGILYLGPENVYNTGKEKYNQYAFTETTKSTTKTLGEWIQGYSDHEEMTRLASLTQDNDFRKFEDVSCAEILQTCNLAKDATSDHKKIYRDKALKFHPDKYKNNHDLKELTEKATMALNRAQALIKENKECAGQDDDGCLSNEIEHTITRILKQPHWLAEKIMGETATCFMQVDDQELLPTSLDICNDMQS